MDQRASVRIGYVEGREEWQVRMKHSMLDVLSSGGLRILVEMKVDSGVEDADPATVWAKKRTGLASLIWRWEVKTTDVLSSPRRSICSRGRTEVPMYRISKGVGAPQNETLG